MHFISDQNAYENNQPFCNNNRIAVEWINNCHVYNYLLLVDLNSKGFAPIWSLSAAELLDFIPNPDWLMCM